MALVTAATLGVVMLQFSIGLQTKPSEFFKVGWSATAVAVFGVAFSVGGGFIFGKAAGYTATMALFIRTARASTSVVVTPRAAASYVLQKMGHADLATTYRSYITMRDEDKDTYQAQVDEGLAGKWLRSTSAAKADLSLFAAEGRVNNSSPFCGFLWCPRADSNGRHQV